MKTSVIFYHGMDDVHSIGAHRAVLESKGITTEVFFSAEKLLKRFAAPQSIGLLTIELVVKGEGNDFGGQRDDREHSNSALLLLHELDVLARTKPAITKIPKIILTSHSMGGHGKIWRETHLDPRIHKALIKKDTSPDVFLEIIEKILK
ncbi:MAG: hypothetical protein WCL18_08875 [bacterium]